MENLPLTVENSKGKIIASLSESLLSIAIDIIERLKHGGTLRRKGEFVYSRGV